MCYMEDSHSIRRTVSPLALGPLWLGKPWLYSWLMGVLTAFVLGHVHEQLCPPGCRNRGDEPLHRSLGQSHALLLEVPTSPLQEDLKGGIWCGPGEVGGHSHMEVVPEKPEDRGTQGNMETAKRPWFLVLFLQCWGPSLSRLGNCSTIELYHQPKGNRVSFVSNVKTTKAAFLYSCKEAEMAH